MCDMSWRFSSMRETGERGTREREGGVRKNENKTYSALYHVVVFKYIKLTGM